MAKLSKAAVKKNRIIGLLLLLCGFLVAVSLLTHDSQSDTAIITDGEIGSLLSQPVINKGGALGVVIAFGLLYMFGYLSLLLPAVIWAVSYGYFFQKDIIKIAKNIGWTASFLFLFGILLSLPYTDAEFMPSSPGLGGITGYYCASALKILTGSVISYTLIISAIIGFAIWFLPNDLVGKFSLVLKPLQAIRRFLVDIIAKAKDIKFKKEKAKPGLAEPETKPEGLLKRIIRIKKKSDHDGVEDEPYDEDEESEYEGDDYEEHAEGGEYEEGEEEDDDDASTSGDEYRYPSVNLLTEPPQEDKSISEKELHQVAEALKETLSSFGVSLANREVEIYPGPIITRYEFKPAPGVKVSRVVNLADDLALAMKAKRIRIVAPIPGKSAIGVEIPNRVGNVVYLKEIIGSEEFSNTKSILPLAIGKTISGKPFEVDLAAMPHLLIAGATGSGKSVCLNSIITSLLYKLSPDLLRFILIDPKMLELSVYNDLPHLEKPVVTEMKYAERVLSEAVVEMEERYRKLAKLGVRNIKDYNSTAKKPIPYVVIIVDELADLMMIGSNRIETLITRLAQMARAVGIHLILATQRPSVDVITGLIKANFSTRIAFQVATKVDSRTILDINGAEKLLGNGDMLYMNPAFPEPKRVHGAFISGAETKAVCKVIGKQKYDAEPIENFKSDGSKVSQYDPVADAVFVEAVATVIKHKQGSVSLLQRRLGIGYQRAARLIDRMEESGIVGPYDGAKAREVLVDEEYLRENFKEYSSELED